MAYKKTFTVAKRCYSVMYTSAVEQVETRDEKEYNE